MFYSRWSTCSALVVILTLTGFNCATGYTTLLISLEPGANPDIGPGAKIVRVEDRREFNVWGSHKSTIHSTVGVRVKENGTWRRVEDPKLTARLVGRKQNHEGVTMGEIVLPQGRTVALAVKTAVERGLREAGIRTLRSDEVGYDEAAELSIAIDEFWIRGGGSFRYKVEINGTLAPFTDAKILSGRGSTHSGGMLMWSGSQGTLDSLFAHLRSKVSEQIRQGGAEAR